MAGKTVIIDTGRLGVVPPETMALAIRAGTVATTAVDERIQAVAAAIIAADPTIKEAAANALAAEIVEQGLVRFVDEGIPSGAERARYVEIVESSDGTRLIRGITDQGVVHAPLQASQQIDLTESPFAPPAARMIASTRPGYARLSIAKGADGFERMAEDALTEDGKIPNWVLERIFDRAGNLGLLTGVGPLKMLIVAGQSNATQRGSSTQVAMNFRDPRVLRWDHSAGVIVDTHPVEWLGTGFARAWVREHPGERVLIVQAALGSTGFRTTSLNPPPAGYVYTSDGGGGTWNRNFTAETGQVDPHTLPQEYLIDRVAAASAAAQAMTGEVPEKLAMLWSQGENDVGNYESYGAWQDDLFTWIRGQWGTPNLPIIVGSMTPYRLDLDNVNVTGLDRVQQDTPSRLSRTAYSRGPSGFEENASRIHYLPLAQEQRGAVMAERAMIRALQNATATDPEVALHPPQRMTANRVGSRVRFEWEHPYCRATSIAGEYSTDGGSSWTPITFPNAMPVEWEITTASPVLLRLSSKNGAFTSYTAEIGA
ncbi:sialate O-acetylesterase [Microbacterium sp. SA156]|uniref:sialate O-acetylesterase n=1 Tax=unclassified Microbacterium TaxID=2609290 RepID=UPI003BA021AE